MRSPILALALLAACSGRAMTDAQVAQAKSEVESTLRAAYDLSAPDVEKRMLSLYPPSGRVTSTSAGHILTSRDTLTAGIKAFWENVGVNMRDPKWIWDSMYIDVLSPTSAVLSAEYHIPHRTPRNEAHVIAGAITAAFVKRDGKWFIIQEHLSDMPVPAGANAANPHANHK